MRVKRKVGIIIAIIASVLLISLYFLKLNLEGLLFWLIYHRLSFICWISLVVGIFLIFKGKKIVKDPPSSWAIKLKEQLPASPTILDKKNLKKIYKLFPVPNDYEIYWAEVQSFGNHPAGIIITDQALILKAPKSEIKKQNKEIKKQNKGKTKEERVSKIPYIYRLIPWEYFSPEDYQYLSDGVNGKDAINSIVIDKNSAFAVKTPELINLFQSYQRKIIEIDKVTEDFEVAAVNSAINSVCVESAIYMAKNGAANTNTGHGIIAEDTGAILDKISGNNATVVGRDNAKNGADKLLTIDGKQISVQCKYCNSAANSIGACFEKNDGLFRYYDLNDKPMTIEVPKDQYLDAIEVMKDKIANGKVPGVTDPNEATKIVRKGSLTYDQARNIAKAGTFESITYDVATASIRCLSVFGISFLVTFALTYWETKDFKQATKSALITGAKIYGLSVLGSVISSQLARSGIENLFYPMMKDVLGKLPESFVNRMAANTSGLVNQKVVAVNGTSDYYARFLSSQLATSCIMFFVFSIPDIYQVVSNNISSGQFVMNMAEKFAGAVVGGAASAVVGSVVGNAVNPFVGGIAGLAAGFVGGTGASLVTRTVVHLFREDDSVIISRMFTAVLINVVMDNMLSQNEQEKLIKLLEQDEKGLKKVQKKLYKSENQARDIKKYLNTKVSIVINSRTKITASDESKIRNNSDTIISTGDFCYEM